MSMIGQTNRRPRAGSPIIGDRISITVGASVVGRIKIGNDSVIGTGSAVNKDIEPLSVVMGNPFRVVSHEGSEGYVNRLVPKDLLDECFEARFGASVKR